MDFYDYGLIDQESSFTCEEENLLKECYYCGNSNYGSLIKCINKKCNLYFCSSPLNNEYLTGSHIYMHMKTRDHFEVALSDDYELRCDVCYNSNCLTLCYKYDEDSGDLTIICRNKCLVDYPEYRSMNLKPIIYEETFDPIFASISEDIKFLNEAQILEIENDLTNGVIKIPYGLPQNSVKKIRMRYNTLDEYKDTFQNLIEAEHQYELYCEETEKERVIMPQWSPKYSKFSFWISDEQCSYKLKDEIVACASNFKVNGVIQSIEIGGRINVSLNGNKVGNESLKSLTIKNLSTDVVYERMVRGLKMMKKIDENFRNLILGYDIEILNMGLHPEVDYSVRGLSPLNPSQNEAVRQALNSMFCLIQGPPGTGKTLTTASIVYHLSKNINRPSAYKCTEAILKQKQDDSLQLFEQICIIQRELDFKQSLMQKFSETQSTKPDFETLKEKFQQHIEELKKVIKNIEQNRDNLYKEIDVLTSKFKQLEDDSERKRVLVTAPSNVAVDHLVQKIISAGLKVVRFYSKSKEEAKNDLSRYSYHKLFLEELNLPENAQMKNLFNTKNKSGLEKQTRAYFMAESKRIRDNILKNVDVVCCTCIGALDNRLEGLNFSKVIIDEACQSREPESLLPLLYRPDQIILVGDNYQLGPIVKCKEIEKAGLMNSLFQRMVDLNRPSYMLKTQYRMHPSISEFPSKNFYRGLLENGINEYDRIDRNSNFRWPSNEPNFFYHIDSPEEHSSNGLSFVNRGEAQKVVEIVSQIGLNADIGVITFYDAQRMTIFKYLSDKCGPNVEIASVDSFQGRDKDYIILSCVRSNQKSGIGFLGNYRRLNVAITRAKFGMIICGNAETLCKSNVWRSLITHYDKKGLIFVNKSNRLERYRMPRIGQIHNDSLYDKFDYLDT